MRAVAVAALLLVGACRSTADPERQARMATARGDVSRLRDRGERDWRARGRCPTLAELKSEDAGARTVDPWGHAYVLLCPGQSGHAVDAVSKGADGDVATSDDVRSWD